MKKLSIAVALALSVVGCNVQTVDMQQPISAADKFYDTLKSGKASTAMTFFAPGFKNTVSRWPKFLGDLQNSFGPVTATELLEASLSANDDSPCYRLVYAVKRGTHATEESLFLCSEQGTSPWLIHGHGLTRSDTGQKVTAGLMPQEISTPTP